MWTEGDATRSECLPTGHWAIMRVIKQLPGDKYHWWDLWEALQDDPRQEKPFFTWGRGKARKRLIWQDNDYPGSRCRQRAGIKSKALFTVKTGRIEHVFQGSRQSLISDYQRLHDTQSETHKVFLISTTVLLQPVTHQLKQEHSSFEIQIPDKNNSTVMNRASCLLLQFTCEDGGEKK